MSRQTTAPVGTAATVQRLMQVFIPISVLVSGLIFSLGTLLYWFTSNSWTLGQQFYINRYHPPTVKDTPVTGQLGKTLAPKPGQRPTRDNRVPSEPEQGHRSRGREDHRAGGATAVRATEAGPAPGSSERQSPAWQEAEPDQEASLTS